VVVLLCATIVVRATRPLVLNYVVHVLDDDGRMEERIAPLLAVGGGLVLQEERPREKRVDQERKPPTRHFPPRGCSAPRQNPQIWTPNAFLDDSPTDLRCHSRHQSSPFGTKNTTLFRPVLLPRALPRKASFFQPVISVARELGRTRCSSSPTVMEYRVPW
jgi:hypothetical protein